MVQVKTIGLIGGVTWESTAEYYKIINTEIAQALGGANSARIALVSLNFADLTAFTLSGNDPAHRRMYCDAARRLEQAGADFLLICSNTGHRRFEDIRQSVSLPILHIADVAAAAIRSAKVGRVGLLGTAATMTGSFITDTLERSGIEVCIPDTADRSELDRLILNELACGVFSERARSFTTAIIDSMAEEKVEGILLACTELPLLLRGCSFNIPTFDTLALHAKAAAFQALDASH